MKTNRIVSAVIISLFLINCSSQKNNLDFEQSTVPNEIEMRKYTLISIDSLKYNYIFFVSRNDSIYKLYSERTEKTLNCQNSLIINNEYNLALHSSYSDLIPMNLHIGGRIGFKSEPIHYPTDSTIVRDLFLSPNIKGKCYIETPLVQE